MVYSDMQKIGFYYITLNYYQCLDFISALYFSMSLCTTKDCIYSVAICWLLLFLNTAMY